MRTSGVVLALIGLGVPVPAVAQDEAPSRPVFEVASVRRSAPPDGPLMFRAGAREGNRWLADNATLRMLMRAAYAPRFQFDDQLVGGPGWMDTERFDVVGTMDPSTAPGDMRAMVQAMLADRFGFAVREDMRELSVYALEAARADGLLGPQIQRLDVDCVEIRAARQRGDAQAPRASGPGRSVDPCFTSTMLGAATRLESGGLTMEQLASTLSRSIGRPVLDRTGLTGYFALTLEFAGEPGARTPFGFVGPGGSAEPADAPSVFSAVQDQLGLRLEPRREMMDVLVIESAHLPAEN